MVDGSDMDQFPILFPPSSSSPLPPHVILVSTPLPGHSIPFLQAAKRLVDEGVTITYVSTDDHISQLLKSSSAASRELRSRGVRFVKLRDGLKHLSGSDFHSYVHSLEGERNMINLLEEVVVELLQSSDHLKESGDASSVAEAALQQRSTPCCLLYDMFSTWSQEVADNHKLAKHLLFVSGAMTLCVFSQARFFFHRS
jgi:sinapate 1-glucosyltransferase